MVAAVETTIAAAEPEAPAAERVLSDDDLRACIMRRKRAPLPPDAPMVRCGRPAGHTSTFATPAVGAIHSAHRGHDMAEYKAAMATPHHIGGTSRNDTER